MDSEPVLRRAPGAQRPADRANPCGAVEHCSAKASHVQPSRRSTNWASSIPIVLAWAHAGFRKIMLTQRVEYIAFPFLYWRSRPLSPPSRAGVLPSTGRTSA